MSTLETVKTTGMVYKPSGAPAEHKTRQSLMLGKLGSWGMEENHTVLTSLDKSGPAMTSQTCSPSVMQLGAGRAKSVDELLFDAKASAKMLMSQVTMYLREGWRDKLFYQLDNLLDAQEWDPLDQALQKRSFETFLKVICDINPTVRPGLGLSYTGNLIAAWTTKSNDQLTLEFEPDDWVQLFVTRYFDEEPEIISARLKTVRLKSRLNDLKCAEWLTCA